MTTLKAALEEFIDQTGAGIYGTADSVTSAGIVSVSIFDNGADGPNDYRRWWIERPTVTGNNKVKQAGKRSTATLNHTSSTAYNDALTDLYFRLWRQDFHPTRYMIPLANRALRRAWQWWRAPLTMVVNGDGEASTVGGSDSTATTTQTTTAAEVHEGVGAYKVTNTAASTFQYHQYATMEAAAGRAFRVSAWLKITTAGTARLQMVDVSNSNNVLAQITQSGVGQWFYLQFSGAFPDTCTQCAIRVGSDTASAVTVWDDVIAYWEPMTGLVGPSWVNDWVTEDGTPAFRLLKHHNRLVGDGAGAGGAFDWTLVNEEDYQVLNMPSAANPARFELGRKLTMDMMPIFVEARRPYDSFNSSPITSDTSTSGCPLDLWVAAMKVVAAEERGLGQRYQWRDDYNLLQSGALSALRTPPPDQEYGLRTFVSRI